jgi:hypothetical protein
MLIRTSLLFIQVALLIARSAGMAGFPTLAFLIVLIDVSGTAWSAPEPFGLPAALASDLSALD